MLHAFDGVKAKAKKSPLSRHAYTGRHSVRKKQRAYIRDVLRTSWISYARTLHLRCHSRRATMEPILPVPTTPAVFPARSKPTSPESEKFLSRTRLNARGIFRFSDRINASVCSAMALGEYEGTRTTLMPSRAAVGR